MTDLRITAGEPIRCHQCGYRCPMAAWVPHSWKLPDGREPAGCRRLVPLCPTCDLADQHAGPLALFLRCHPEIVTGGPITREVLKIFSLLVVDWVPHATVPVASEKDFADDVAAWQAGELDGSQPMHSKAV